MKNNCLKSISYILVLVLLINMLPMSAFAEEYQEGLTAVSEEIKELDTTNLEIVEEIPEKRTEYTKEFLLSNGLHMAAIYPDAVHYEKNGNWQEIDNTLTAKEDGTFTNTAGVWNVSFPQTLTGAKSVTIEKDGYTLSFAMAGELRNSGELMSTKAIATQEQFSVAGMQQSVATITEMDRTALAESYQYPEMVPEKQLSRLTYANVYQNTDVIYDLDSNKVKESIVMDAYSSTLRGYRYTLNVGAMIPVLEEDGQITFYDSDRKNVVMVMPAPYLIDDAGETSCDITVQLTGNGSAYTLTYLLPQQWLAETERAWPVILDPVVVAALTTANIRDRTVASNGTFSQTATTLSCGYSEVNGVMRTYLKYRELPPLTSADVVVAASVQMYQMDTPQTVTTMEVHKVNGEWESETITWANKPAYDTTVEDYALVDNYGAYTWVVTDIVRDWYAGKNTGMMFKASDAIETGGTMNFKKFHSSDNSVNKPVLAIWFRNNSGLESYWDYTASSAGRAGTGYINNFTGNLVWIRDDLSVTGNRMPVTIRHIYNANDRENNTFGMGYGWRSNYNQLVYQWGDNSNYYVWEDADGTRHYFKHESGSTYKDEDGLELTLTVGSNGTEKYCITDKNGNQSFFDTYGRLRTIKNNQQTPSNVSISYTSTSGKMISGIVDGAGRVYRYFYSNGLLSHAVYRGTGNVNLSHVICTYEGTQLTKLTDTDGTESLYGYTSGLLSSITDSDDYTLTYTYHTLTDATWQPYRVESVTETDADENRGGSLSIQYAHNQTTFTDHNGNVEIHQFNDFGNTVSIQDDEGHATYAQYTFNTDNEKNNNLDASKKGNQMRLSSKLQNTVGNRFPDSSFENGSVWSPHGTNITTSVTTETAYYGAKSQKIVNPGYGKNKTAFSRNFYIYPGETVTASAYIKNPDSHTTLELHFRDSATATYSSVSSPVLPISQDWQRGEVTFTNTGNEAILTYIHLRVENPGTYYVDCVQVEKAASASRYNLVENGDFNNLSSSAKAYGWNRGVYLASTDGFNDISDAAAPELDGNVYGVIGSTTAQKHLFQSINVSGAKGDSFVLAGWAKGKSAPLNSAHSGEREFGITATFVYTDGTSVREVLNFNPDANEDTWQYAAKPLVAQKAYSSIIIEVVYNHNVNTVYFDGIQLFKEEFGSSYAYDEDGNVKSVVDLQKQATTYEYDTSNNLTKVIQNNQAKMTYTYDSWHNVLTATTQEGLVYNFTYDTYGNNTSVSITSGGNTMTSSATYSADGNRLESTTDALGKVTRYGYDEITNVLEWVQYPEDTEDTRTEYSYDNMYRLISAACETDMGNSMSATYTYADDRLTQITTPTTTYSFTYGFFGLREGVRAGGRYLVEYVYTNDRNYYLSELDYGNGDIVTYKYDKKGRITEEAYYGAGDTATVTYAYDNNGALARMTDSETGITTSYYYDLTDRMMKYIESGDGYSHSVDYEYDTQNNLTQLVETINGVVHTASYTYDEDNRIKTITNGPVIQHNTYDGFGRAYQQIAKYNSTNVLTRTATFQSPQAGKTSTQVATYTLDAAGYDVTYTYTYDDNGNITSISDGTNTVSYVYDSANQLIRENNQAGGYTYTWTYDSAGNIQNRKEYAYTTGTLGTPTDTVTYTYGDSRWGDLLTAYDGTAITYDGVGNMLSDGERYYEWKNGRELRNVLVDSVDWFYTYDANGMRTKRTNGTDTYTYVYNGSQLSKMFKGADTLYFTYDAGGVPLSVTYNNTIYYYVTNLQGDVIGILDRYGAAVVNYAYDAWGNPLSTTGSMATTLGTTNPLRYRGYVYDQETGLYYVSSRYYDPEIGRWINADALVDQSSVLGYNLFAYCRNNPVNMTDTTGNLPFFAITAAIGAVVGAVVGGVVAAKNGGNVWAGVGIGAAAGALIGTGAGMAAGAALAGSITATTGAVMAGGSTLVATVGTGGLGAGATYIANNLSQAANNLAPAAQTAASKMQEVATKGKAGEALSGLAKNTSHIPSLTGTASYRIPDGLDAGMRILSEVKNYSGTLSYTNQLKDFVMWSQANGYQMHLYTNATLTGPLQQVVDSGIIQLFPLG